MSFEEEFDKIIKQKVDEAGFPFDEKNWQKMSAQLDVERKRGMFTRGRRVYTAGVLFLFFSVIGLIFGVIVLKNNPSNPSEVVSNTPNKKDLNTITNNNIITANKSGTRKENQIAEDAPVNRKTIVDVKNDQKIAERTLVPKSAVKTTANDNTVSLPSNGIAGLKKQNTAAKNLNAETPASIEGKEAENSRKPASAKPDESSVDSRAVAPVENNSASSRNNNENLAKVIAEVPEIFETAQLVAINTAVSSEEQERDIRPSNTKVSFSNFYDEDYYRAKKIKTHFLNVEAGTTYLNGWQLKNGTDGKGFNWFAGINYGLYLSRKITAGAGLQFYNITNIAQPFYSISRTEYGFSSIKTSTVITARSLYYVSMPLKFTYALNAQSQFGVGMNIGFLMNAKNNVETYTSSENGKTNDINIKKAGAYQGIASSNLLLSVFYRTQIAKRIALNGELIYGLTDLFKSTATNNNNTENAVGLRVGLQYTLFDK